jgi:NAD(P)-dependent dehydrogenase (short-subunit alcohol dehydrogenase family)
MVAKPLVVRWWRRKRGHIVNVASAAGYYAAPDMSAYSASKHAVMGLSESLRIELAEFNVGVSAICPGVINTNIVAAMRTNGEVVQAQAKLLMFIKNVIMAQKVLPKRLSVQLNIIEPLCL